MNQDSKLPLDENARLMRKAADGDIDAFKRLYRSFAPLLRLLFVRRSVDRCSADDFVQKIFTCLWEQRKSFRGESTFETYLSSIAMHTLNKEIRQSHNIAEISSKKHQQSDGDTCDILSQPESEFYFQELTDALETAKAKLTDEQLQALDASQVPDIAFHKALEELACSKGAYQSRLKRARKRLRVLLAPFFTDEKRRKKG
jgi:RNA polymerase sigma-70 factor (ECF subfamily)